MRISDWSSDVCSSYLLALRRAFGDVEQDDITQFLHRGEVGERSADHAGADKRDLLASHKTSPIAITSGTRMVTRSARLRSSLRPIRKLDRKSTRLNSSH